MNQKKAGGTGNVGTDGVPIMEEGVFYNLNSPATVKGKTISRVRCDYRVPNCPNEYALTGIPEGETEPFAFILRYVDSGPDKVIMPTKSEKQSF